MEMITPYWSLVEATRGLTLAGNDDKVCSELAKFSTALAIYFVSTYLYTICHLTFKGYYPFDFKFAILILSGIKKKYIFVLNCGLAVRKVLSLNVKFDQWMQWS